MANHFKKTKISWFASIAAVIILTGLLYAGFVLSREDQGVIAPSSPHLRVSEWQEYTNKQFHYRLEFPSSWQSRDFTNKVGDADIINFISFDPPSGNTLLEVRVYSTSLEQKKTQIKFAFLVDSYHESVFTLDGRNGLKLWGEIELEGIDNSRQQMVSVLVDYMGRTYDIRYYRPLYEPLEDQVFLDVMNSWQLLE